MRAPPPKAVDEVLDLCSSEEEEEEVGGLGRGKRGCEAAAARQRESRCVRLGAMG